MASRPCIEVQVVSDIICPWCWVGKRRLEAAMRLCSAKYTFRVSWEPYLLRPDMPEEGMEKPEAYRDIKYVRQLVRCAMASGMCAAGVLRPKLLTW